MERITVIIIFTGALLYAIFRYIIFGNVAWDQLPLFITNKALSFSGLILLIISPILKHYGKKENNIFRSAGFIFICLHSVISVILLNKFYFLKFFNESGTFRFDSGISMIAGIISLISLLFVYFEKTGFGKNNNKLFYFILLILPLIHIFLIGYGSWLSFSSWPGGMPPITMISFLIYAAVLVINLIRKSFSI